jgi:aryl-alcohol dehydrogenase-like predicted oxidoreductase
MQYRRLGNSGLTVSIIGLGGTTFGQHATFKHYSDESGSVGIIDRAADLGINLLDTADMYADGVSESYIGKAIAGRRDRFIIASKVGMPVGDGPNDAGLSRGHIMDSIEGTLRRLGTDYVDLYYAHVADPTTPIEETLRAFDDLIRQGKVRYVGCSNFAGWQIGDAHAVAERRGYAQFSVSQSPYNLFERSIEAEVVPCCLHYGMSIVAYAPLAQGILTGKYRRGAAIPPNTRAWQNPSKNLASYMTDAKLAMVERLDTWARDAGHGMVELAISWLVAKPFVSSILTGVTSIDQLETNVKATDWRLTREQVTEVEDIANLTIL